MEKEKSSRQRKKTREEIVIDSQHLVDARDAFSRLLEVCTGFKPIQLLRLTLQSSSVTVDTQWRVYLEENKSNPLFQVLPLATALDLFMAYIQELEKKETKILKLAQIEDQKYARKLRENYRVCLFFLNHSLLIPRHCWKKKLRLAT